jgi:hypothetical protein
MKRVDQSVRNMRVELVTNRINILKLNLIYLCILFYLFSLALQPSAGYDLLVHEVS